LKHLGLDPLWNWDCAYKIGDCEALFQWQLAVVRALAASWLTAGSAPVAWRAAALREMDSPV
jgi:hypothetical protein